jgi:hypothetical protein
MKVPAAETPSKALPTLLDIMSGTLTTDVGSTIITPA